MWYSSRLELKVLKTLLNSSKSLLLTKHKKKQWLHWPGATPDIPEIVRWSSWPIVLNVFGQIVEHHQNHSSLSFWSSGSSMYFIHVWTLLRFVDICMRSPACRLEDPSRRHSAAARAAHRPHRDLWTPWHNPERQIKLTKMLQRQPQTQTTISLPAKPCK